jgi:hypothetical protein
MRRRAATSLLALLLLGLLAATAASGQVEQRGDLRVHFKGNFFPRALPRDTPAPISIHVASRIGTTDGSTPPPLKRFEIALNRNGHLSTEGLPTCTSPELQATSSATAKARCHSALIGRGSYRADVALAGTGTVSATGSVLAFNGRQGRENVVLLHLYGTVPVSATFIVIVHVAKPSVGRFGTVLRGTVPPLAGGLGAIKSLDLTIGRRYRYRGQRRSLITASCAAPVGFPVVSFPLARGSFYFAGHQPFSPVLSRNCRVR